jgi:hypothetical protein
MACPLSYLVFFWQFASNTAHFEENKPSNFPEITGGFFFKALSD